MVKELTRSTTCVASGAVAINRFVEPDGNGQYGQASNGGDAVGVSATAATAAGETFTVDHISSVRVEVEAGAAVALSALVGSNASGQAIVATADDAVLGYAETAAGAAGEIITVFLAPKPADVNL